MNTVQLLAALFAALGGFGGLATSLRAKSQNRVDDATSRRENAEADSIAVDTARELIAQVREEMDRRVNDLQREVDRLHGRLEGTSEERDRFRREAEATHRENAELKARVALLEERVRELTAELDRSRPSAA